MAEKKLLPIGTVIKVASSKAMIIGHRMRDAETLEMKYIVVPYPAGFSNVKNLKMISGDVEVVNMGFETELTHQLTESLGELYTAAEKMPKEEFLNCINDARKKLEEM